jgi:hypothetical protein
MISPVVMMTCVCNTSKVVINGCPIVYMDLIPSMYFAHVPNVPPNNIIVTQAINIVATWYFATSQICSLSGGVNGIV